MKNSNEFKGAKTPLVSVVMPTYNRASSIKASAQSVLQQSYKNIELIIVDDGSSDDTESVVKALSDERVVYAKNENNLGIQKTLNHGLDLSKGKYIARIDDQDEWIDADKLKYQVSFLESHTNYVLVGTAVVFTNSSGEELYRYTHPETDRQIRNNLLSKNLFIHSSVMFLKSAAIDSGGYSESDELKHVEDYDLWLRLGTMGALHNLQRYSVSYVVDEHGLTSKNRVEQIKRNLLLVHKYRDHYPHYVWALIRFNLRLIVYGYLRLSFLSRLTAHMSPKGVN